MRDYIRKIYFAYVMLFITCFCVAASSETRLSSYNSFEDTTCWNGCYVIKGNTVYSILQESDWGDTNQKSFIRKSDISDMNGAKSIYGPMRGRLNYLMDGGDRLLFVKDAKSGQILYSLDYNNIGSVRRVAKFDKEAKSFIRIGDELYYIVRKMIRSYNLNTGGKKRLYKSNDKPLGDQLEYAYGRLYFAKMDYEPVQNADKRGIHSLELNAGKVRRLTYGEVFPFTVLGKALYTYNEGINLPVGLIRMDLDGANAQRINDEFYYFDKAHNGYLLARHREDPDTVRVRLFALSNEEPLFDPNKNKSVVLNGTANFLLGEYYVRSDPDENGDKYTVIPISKITFSLAKAVYS